MTRYAIGLGSNLGSRIGNMRGGVRGLSRLGRVQAVSGLYESAPVGGPEQDPYLNAIVVLESDIPPRELLAGLHEVEADTGRERNVEWGPRTLDLDIVATESPHESPGLSIPHVRAVEREFVLRPLVDVWPDAMVARSLSAEEALAGVGDQGVDELSRHWVDEARSWQGGALFFAQLAWFLVIAAVMAVDGDLPDGEVGWTRVLGLAFAVVGGGLAFVSSRRLGPALTARPEPRSGSDLVISGPYAAARHPIYGGVTLFILGTALIVDSFWGVVVSLGLIPFFLVKSSYEERLLRIAFPAYRAYRLTVSRRLIPFLL